MNNDIKIEGFVCKEMKDRIDAYCENKKINIAEFIRRSIGKILPQKDIKNKLGAELKEIINKPHLTKMIIDMMCSILEPAYEHHIKLHRARILKNKPKRRAHYFANKEELIKIAVENQRKRVAANPERERKKRQDYNKLASTKERRKLNRQNKPKIKRIKSNKEKLRLRLSVGIRRALKHNKTIKTAELLGCSMDHFMKHIESKFLINMTWDNYGRWTYEQPMKWHIDHIIPCDTFNLDDEHEQRKCFHYTNLRPLWADENIRKGNKVDGKLIAENNIANLMPNLGRSSNQLAS